MEIEIKTPKKTSFQIRKNERTESLDEHGDPAYFGDILFRRKLVIFLNLKKGMDRLKIMNFTGFNEKFVRYTINKWRNTKTIINAARTS